MRYQRLGRSLRTAFGTVGFARGVDDCTRVRLAVARPGVTSRGRLGPTTGCVTVASHMTARPSDRSRSRVRSWRPRQSRRDRGNSGSRVEPAPAVAGGSTP